MLLFGLLCSPSRDPGCIPRCCVLLCTFGDVVCRGAVYVPGYCVSGHAIRVVCPVSRDAAPGTLQAVFLVGRTRFDRLAFEGFARLEVVGHSDREAAVVPLLFDVDHAHEPVAAGADVLRALDQVAHRERGGELVAETLLDSGVQEMERFYPAVAEVHAALEPVRQVDVEFRGQREGRRAVYEIEVVMFFGAVLVDALPLPDVGEVEVHRPPFGELERCVGREVIVFRRVEVGPRQAQARRVVRVGAYRLLYLVALDRHAAREGVLVLEHQRQADVLLVSRVEFGVSRLVGVVRDLEPLRVEAPEARALDRAGILGDERVGPVFGQGIGDVRVGEEAEVVLRDVAALAPGVGVFAPQPCHEAPAPEVGRGDAVSRRDVLRIVDREALVVVAHPRAVLHVFVERVVVHVVVGELDACAQRPAGREFLVEGQRGGRDVVEARRVVAVGRVDGRGGGVRFLRSRLPELRSGQQRRADKPDKQGS